MLGASNGIEPLPSAYAASTMAAGMPCGDTPAFDRRAVLQTVGALLGDIGTLTTWQVVAWLLRVHPDRVPCSAVRIVSSWLAANDRFDLAAVPRPASHLWAPYWACGRLRRGSGTGPVPPTWAAWCDRLGTSDVCMRSVVGHAEVDTRRAAVDVAREQMRMWQRSPRLHFEHEAPALQMVALRRPVVRIPSAMCYHHLAAVECALVLGTWLWPHTRPARALADGRLAQGDLRDVWRGNKRPDVLFKGADGEKPVALEFVSREYGYEEVAGIRDAMDASWVIVASSRQVAQRLTQHLHTRVWYV